MSTTTVKINHEIVGNGFVSNDFYTEDLTIVGKIEREFESLLSTDGYINVPVSKIGTIQVITAESTNAKIRINDDSVSGVILSVSGKLFWEVPPTYADTITSIDVATDSTTAISAILGVWGV